MHRCLERPRYAPCSCFSVPGWAVFPERPAGGEQIDSCLQMAIGAYQTAHDGGMIFCGALVLLPEGR
jgi:hypothetical protein